MMIRHAAALSAAIALTAIARTTGAATPQDTGTVMLTLSDGVAPRAENAREGRDMELELTLRDGKFDAKTFGYAVWFNRADHEGTVEAKTAGDTTTLTVKLKVTPDKWYPAAPGEAVYTIDLKRVQGGFEGSYSGTFSYPAKDGENKVEVQGPAGGKLFPLWTLPAEGFKPLGENEHPRLIFRKADLPGLKKRLETPEGEAMFEQFMKQLPRQFAGNNKNQPMFPAGYALAYQLTGDKAHADKARELIAPMLNLGGSQDIHYGPIAMGFALTLDMCYDAWGQDDEGQAFRAKLMENLAKRTKNLATGTGIGTFAPNPWHNHNGVRAPSTGVAALTLLGEKDASGKPYLADAERIAYISARDTRRYFELGGITRTGWCLEGAFYKRMTWNSGPGHFVHAYKTALGGDMLAGYPDDFGGVVAILGEYMEHGRDRLAPAFDLGDAQSSGLWPLGMAITPKPLQPGVKWLFDRSYGLQGNKSFGIHWAYEAGFVLAGYPFDVAAKEPAESLPWAMPDVWGGHYIFRKPWSGGGDSQMVLHARSHIMPGCHYERSGKTMDMQLFAAGKQWIGPGKFSEDLGGGCALPPLGEMKGGVGNEFLGAKTTHYAGLPDGRASLSLNMDAAYFEQLGKGAAAPAGAKLVPSPRGGNFADKGIRATRHMAVDFSGKAGVPALIVMLDQYEAPQPTWAMGFAREAGSPAIDGSKFTFGDAKGTSLTGRFLTPADVKLEGSLKAKGGKSYLVVMTAQAKNPPEIKTEGDGETQKITVGETTVWFDGSKFVFSR